MAVDTPAKIVIIGAGPIGIEAGLYARFLGYEVVIFERGRVGEHLRQWGHLRMLTPFGQNRSPLGLAALSTQNEAWQPPADDQFLTGTEYVESYLEPLAQSDLLADGLRLGHQVLAIGREGFLKGDVASSEDRGAFDLRLLVRDAEGREFVENADVLIDASGVFGQPNWLGSSGIPAVGERSAAAFIERHLPDILGTQRAHYAGLHTLVIGAGTSAATNVAALAQLAKSAPGTRITWLSRRESPAQQAAPLRIVKDDPLAARRELAAEAERLCADPSSPITLYPLTDVEALRHDEAANVFTVELSGQHAGSITCDRVIANVGYRPDTSLWSELQLAPCAVTQAVLAPQEGANASAADAPSSILPEPNFYVLGHKRSGRGPDFLLSQGLRQIVEVFAVIGDRATLDLYATAPRLLP